MTENKFRRPGVEHGFSRERKQDRPITVFISYAGPNHGMAVELDKILTQKGYKTIRYQRDFHVDTDFVDEISNSVGKADYTVALVTSAYVSSTWCVKEFKASKEVGKLVPVLVEECDASNLPEVPRFIDLRGLDSKQVANALRTQIDQYIKPVHSPSIRRFLNNGSREKEKTHETIEKTQIIIPLFAGTYDAERWQRHVIPFIETLLADENIVVTRMPVYVSSKAEAEKILRKQNADIMLYGAFRERDIQFGFVSSRGWKFKSDENTVKLPENMVFKSRFENFDDLIPALMLAYGNLEAARNHPDKAMAHLKEAIGRGVSVDRARGIGLQYVFTYMGRIKAESKLWREAEVLLTKAIQLDDKTVESFELRGYVYNNLGQYEKAVLDLSKAIAMGGSAVAYCNRSFSYNELKQFKKAVADAMEAVRLNPSFYKSHHNLGFAYSGLGLHAKAIESLSNSLALNPRDLETVLIRGKEFMSLSEFKKAIHDFSRVIRSGKYQYVYEIRAQAYSALGQFDEAIKDLTEFVRNDSNYKGYLYRGKIYQKIGMEERAARDFLQFIQRSPNISTAKADLEKFGIFINS